MAFGNTVPELFGNCPGVHTFCDHFSGGNHSKTGTGREIAAVYDVDVSQFLCGDAAVLVRTGKRVAEVDMNDLVPLFNPRAEMIDIFLNIYRGGFRKYFVVVVLLIDLLRRDSDIVQIVFFVQVDVMLIIVDVLAFF